MRQTLNRLEGFVAEESGSTEETSLFKQISDLTAPRPVSDTISALSGVLVRELASAVCLHGAAADMPERVLRIILSDSREAIANWRKMVRH